MKDGFFRAAAATPRVNVADPAYNRTEICRQIEEGVRNGAGLMVFPELCLTAYTCNDLFLQQALIQQTKEELKEILACTKDKEVLVFVGLPWEHGGRLFNCAAAICGGRLLGLIPKRNLPNYGEFYEQRYFAVGTGGPVMTEWQGEPVPMGSRISVCLQIRRRRLIARRRNSAKTCGRRVPQHLPRAGRGDGSSELLRQRRDSGQGQPTGGS